MRVRPPLQSPGRRCVVAEGHCWLDLMCGLVCGAFGGAGGSGGAVFASAPGCTCRDAAAAVTSAAVTAVAAAAVTAVAAAAVTAAAAWGAALGSGLGLLSSDAPARACDTVRRHEQHADGCVAADQLRDSPHREWRRWHMAGTSEGSCVQLAMRKGRPACCRAVCCDVGVWTLCALCRSGG